MKHSAEDLREAMANYAEVEAVLTQLGVACLLPMLRAHTAQAFPGFIGCAAAVSERLGPGDDGADEDTAVEEQHEGS